MHGSTKLSSASPTSLILSFAVPIILVMCTTFIFAIVLKPSHNEINSRAKARLRVATDKPLTSKDHVSAKRGSSEAHPMLESDGKAAVTRSTTRRRSTKKRDSSSRASIKRKKTPSRGPKSKTPEMEPSTNNDWETTLTFNPANDEQKHQKASPAEKATEDELQETTPEE
ncbi:uncharacterized protein LOC144136533 isoform X3 [Amblyomma americanum]